MSTFFLQHKDIFEYDKFVGGGTITSSTPSFLDRYRECDRQQAADVAQSTAIESMLRLDVAVAPPSPFMIAPIATIHSFDTRLGPPHLGISSFPPQSAFAHASSSPRQPVLVGSHPRSPVRRAAENFSIGHTGASDSDYFHHPSRSPEKSLSSPKRTNKAPELTRGVVPKLNELLIDASTRAGLLGPSKRLDEAKKVELLIGSKCVGRISAAASSNLPPAIRHRLDASSMIHLRRERLYTLLKDEYVGLTG